MYVIIFFLFMLAGLVYLIVRSTKNKEAKEQELQAESLVINQFFNLASLNTIILKKYYDSNSNVNA